MKIILNWFIYAAAILVAAYVLPGVEVSGFLVALVLAVVLGVINVVLRPIFIILTLPLTILSLGFFVFIINAILVEIAAFIVPGFEVANFWWALLFAIILSIVNAFLHSLDRKNEEQ